VPFLGGGEEGVDGGVALLGVGGGAVAVELFDGVGQEVINASLQILIYIFLCVLAAATVRHSRGFELPGQLFSILMTASVMLAIIREGSEIMIYLSGFMQIKDQLIFVLSGSIIGAGIGVSVGAVFYYALLNLGRRAAILVGAALLALVAAGMVSQATQLLIQADWLPSQYPLWDSSSLISEHTVTGQLLYALVGYEATPTPLQMLIYVAPLLLIIGVGVMVGWRRNDEAETINA
jgi:high-affinity iron transporter